MRAPAHFTPVDLEELPDAADAESWLTPVTTGGSRPPLVASPTPIGADAIPASCAHSSPICDHCLLKLAGSTAWMDLQPSPMASQPPDGASVSVVASSTAGAQPPQPAAPSPMVPLAQFVPELDLSPRHPLGEPAHSAKSAGGDATSASAHLLQRGAAASARHHNLHAGGQHPLHGPGRYSLNPQQMQRVLHPPHDPLTPPPGPQQQQQQAARAIAAPHATDLPPSMRSPASAAAASQDPQGLLHGARPPTASAGGLAALPTPPPASRIPKPPPLQPVGNSGGGGHVGTPQGGGQDLAVALVAAGSNAALTPGPTPGSASTATSSSARGSRPSHGSGAWAVSPGAQGGAATPPAGGVPRSSCQRLAGSFGSGGGGGPAVAGRAAASLTAAQAGARGGPAALRHSVTLPHAPGRGGGAAAVAAAAAGGAHAARGAGEAQAPAHLDLAWTQRPQQQLAAVPVAAEQQAPALVPPREEGPAKRKRLSDGGRAAHLEPAGPPQWDSSPLAVAPSQRVGGAAQRRATADGKGTSPAAAAVGGTLATPSQVRPRFLAEEWG